MKKLSILAAVLFCLSCSTDSDKVEVVNATQKGVTAEFSMNGSKITLAPGQTFIYNCTEEFIFSAPDQGSLMPRSLTYRQIDVYHCELRDAQEISVQIQNALQIPVILKEKNGYFKEPDTDSGIKITSAGTGNATIYTSFPNFGVYSETIPDMIVGTVDYKIDENKVMRVVIR